MKASDIDDRLVMEAIAHHPSERGIGTPIWAVFERFPDFPEKVVRAKLHALLRRKLIYGCVCGCRGDFTITPLGRSRWF
jgi:hypothetical protein